MHGTNRQRPTQCGHKPMLGAGRRQKGDGAIT